MFQFGVLFLVIFETETTRGTAHWYLAQSSSRQRTVPNVSTLLSKGRRITHIVAYEAQKFTSIMPLIYFKSIVAVNKKAKTDN